MKARVSLYLTAVVLLVVMGATIGCSKAPNDSQIMGDVQSQISSDSGLQGKQLSVQSSNGVVTLSGTVDNDNQRAAAARYASMATGVKQVVNNLQVAPPVMAQMPPETPAPAPAPAPVHMRARSTAHRTRTMPTESNSEPMMTPMTTTTTATQSTPAPPPPPPLPPAPVKVTIPSGTTLAIRLVDTLDSETAQQGQTFHATLDTPLAVEGDVAIPSGYDVEGHVVEVKSAGKFAGQSVLTLQLDRIAVGSKYYNIQTNQWTKQGTSRGKNTAEKVGVGAGIGAVIGAIAGGGKGAAIGAAAGGGLGGGVQAATKGQQIKLPSETVLNFTLQGPLTVLPTNKAAREARQSLDTNNQ